MSAKIPALDPRFTQFFENLNLNLLELKKGQLPIYRGKISALKREAEVLKASKGEKDVRLRAVNEKIGGLERLVGHVERDVNLGDSLLRNPPRPDGWALLGEVVDPETGKGVSGVRVEVFDRSGEPIMVKGRKVTATTDEKGGFHIDCAGKDLSEFLAGRPEVTVKAFDASGKVIHIQSGVRPAAGGVNFTQVLAGGEGTGVTPGRLRRIT